MRKVGLSPEASSASALAESVAILFGDGLSVFDFVYHIASLELDNTPYVTSEPYLKSFIAHGNVVAMLRPC